MPRLRPAPSTAANPTPSTPRAAVSAPEPDSTRAVACPDVLLCLGTRPEIIKLAPVERALRARGLSVAVLHTGQHDAMAWPLYRFFGMAPQHRLAPRRPAREQRDRTEPARDRTDWAGRANHAGTRNHAHHAHHADQADQADRTRPDGLAPLAARLLEGIDAALARLRPRCVLVQGDTSSALAGALAAFWRGVPVGHVEAGLRTATPDTPFPEEMNRRLIARLARWHFAPTARARDQLLAEGIDGASVALVGNTVIDAARFGVEHLGQSAPPGLPAPLPALAARCRLILLTAHRRENWGAGIAAIATAARALLLAEPDCAIVWPLHANPAIAATATPLFAALPAAAARRLVLTGPLDYPALLWLLRAAWLVWTDSGGIQEEACALGKPVLVLRAATERMELIEAGGGLLVGTDCDTIVATTRALAADPARHAALRARGQPFGDGQAGTRIAALLARALATAPAAPAGPAGPVGPDRAAPRRPC